jgi:arylsulfatase A-like enzyme
MAKRDASNQKKPNILVIWGDDIGVHNVSAYNRRSCLESRRNRTARGSFTGTARSYTGSSGKTSSWCWLSKST